MLTSRYLRGDGPFYDYVSICFVCEILEEMKMAISKELLEILVCPACKSDVELKADGSALKCVECHRVYPIRDDIPIMLVDQATIEEESGESEEGGKQS